MVIKPTKCKRSHLVVMNLTSSSTCSGSIPDLACRIVKQRLRSTSYIYFSYSPSSLLVFTWTNTSIVPLILSFRLMASFMASASLTESMVSMTARLGEAGKGNYKNTKNNFRIFHKPSNLLILFLCMCPMMCHFISGHWLIICWKSKTTIKKWKKKSCNKVPRDRLLSR